MAIQNKGTLFQPDAEGARTQFAALCYRVVKDKPQILLITSRGTRRWIVPKGWPMAGKTPGACALREAYEEAGVIGRVADRPLGIYPYIKLMDDRSEVPCAGLLFPVRVSALRAEYPEVGERRRKWVSRKNAAARVDEPALAQLIRDFDPRQFRL
ncbi:NUDIX hydrolase [Pseudooceanicola sp.]|uniref:NUDIX hydrolase n=1 Tax=Pseudooceanicola sp. TaxID=1914328 RepID=UPI00260EF085|nr:NUDIX hydrolase [Pseudooceanicola sp.]MDF1856700.1 NUDIX hydrolase [Pseudooceanicola sp.]